MCTNTGSFLRVEPYLDGRGALAAKPALVANALDKRGNQVVPGPASTIRVGIWQIFNGHIRLRRNSDSDARTSSKRLGRDDKWDAAPASGFQPGPCSVMHLHG